MPFGYGPASKLIAIARGLAGGARLIFVGRGPALELVSRTVRLFDEIVAASPADAAVAPRFAAVDAVLSVMDREAGLAAARESTPLYVVDSLLWMRPEVPEALRGAHTYWAQAFPGLDPKSYAPQPTVVGPLVARREGTASDRREGLVVHLGGSATPDDRQRLLASYARVTLGAIQAAGLVERYRRVTFLGGASVVAALESVARDARVGLETLSSEEARERMAGAEAVLTAPGLTATLECFCDRTPTWFLPPQNYSQWCTLGRLRELGIAETALHWEDLDGVPRFPRGLRPSEHDPAVSETIARLLDDRAVAARLAAGLATLGAGAQELARQQGDFFASLGENGIDVVARTLGRLEAGSSRRASAEAGTRLGNSP